MLNYIHIILTVGTTIEHVIDVPYEDFAFDDEKLYHKFLCVIQSVYDSKIFHKFIVEVDRYENMLILHMCSAESSIIEPGRYLFNLLSTSDSFSNQTITKITEGIIYFQPSMGQDLINQKYAN